MKTSITFYSVMALLLITFFSSGFKSAGNSAIKAGVSIQDRCPECNGSGKCHICEGSGMRTCDACKGSGEEGTVRNADGTITHLKCYTCSGRGEGKCYSCKDHPGLCFLCYGSGKYPNQSGH